MPGSREIKRRIRSIGSTKKITRAMQMVSAVKMRKAQAAAVNSRTYSKLAWQIVTNLSQRIDPKYHKLLAEGDNSKKIGIILVTTNRGLVGAFNANLISAVNQYIAENKLRADLMPEVITFGKKGRDTMLRRGARVMAEFEKPERAISTEEIFPISKLAVDQFVSGNYGKILIAYTQFISTVKQKSVIKQILPLKQPEQAENLPADSSADLPEHYKKFNYEYLFEPNPQEVLEYLLPRIIDSQIYQAALENDASEHSARMVMMKNATDAATDLIDDLTLAFNQLRQANITKELSEIIAGMRK
jgi:F-type H+-transporting ATPase subunit gamma